MLRNIFRQVRSVNTRTFFPKNMYRMSSEVPRYDPSKDYYSTLEINKDCSDSQVKQAYYRLAKAYHPDSNPGKQSKFKQINEAYSVLSDPALRKQYNSARMFSDFSRRMGRRSQQTNYNYEQMRSMYDNLSKQQKQEITEQTMRKVRKVVWFGIAMLIFLPFVTRTNHRYYVLDNGELVPVQFQGGFKRGMIPNPMNLDPKYLDPQRVPSTYNSPQHGRVTPNYTTTPPTSYQTHGPGYKSAYNQPETAAFSGDPYSAVVRGIGQPPPGYRQQSNLQPGYRGPVAPE